MADNTDLDLSDATISSLTRLLRDELVEMCEARGIEVGGTKPVLAKALLEWVCFYAEGVDSIADIPARRAKDGQ